MPARTSGQPSHCRSPQLSPSTRTSARPATSTSAIPRLRSSSAEPGAVLVVGRHQQPGGAVQHQSGAAEEHQHDEGHPHDDGVDVEVPGQAAGDAGDAAVLGGTAQPAEVPDLVAGDAGTLRAAGSSGAGPGAPGGASGGVDVMAPA